MAWDPKAANVENKESDKLKFAGIANGKIRS
jgi:hypothetical protein